jgi:hypothetical protein
VKYDGAVELEVPVKFYKEKGWQPFFDELPWFGENAEEKQKIGGSEPAPS